ncbi:SsgA family sporulation/cell division regulator [Streptomyces achromogenes]
MSQHLTPVLRAVTAVVSVPDRRGAPLPARLRYDRADPYAVRLSLGRPGTGPVDWVFARDLLAEGLRRPAGEGDVLVFPRHGCLPDTLRIVLRRPGAGAALVELPASETERFLRDTWELVPPGTETAHAGIESGLAQLTARRD